jgi:hypothetical protein
VYAILYVFKLFIIYRDKCIFLGFVFSFFVYIMCVFHADLHNFEIQISFLLWSGGWEKKVQKNMRNSVRLRCTISFLPLPEKREKKCERKKDEIYTKFTNRSIYFSKRMVFFCSQTT